MRWIGPVILCVLATGCGPKQNPGGTGSATDTVDCATELDRVLSDEAAPRDHIAAEIQRVVPRCGSEVAAPLADHIKVWHHQAATTKDVALMELTVPLYVLHLAQFRDFAGRATLAYYYAELLWQLAELETDAQKAGALWGRAARAFRLAVDEGGLEAELRKEAAYASVLAIKNNLATATDGPGADDHDGAPDPIPAAEREMVDAFRWYVQTVESVDDDERVMMQFLEARVYWRFEHYDEAVPLLVAIIEAHPRHETAEYSVNLLLDSLNVTQRYAELLDWTRKLLQRPDLLADRPDLVERLTMLDAQGTRKAIEDLEAAGDYAGCGRGYRDLFLANPGAGGGDELLYNAGVCFQKAGDGKEAVSALERLIAEYPDSPLGPRARERLVELRKK